MTRRPFVLPERHIELPLDGHIQFDPDVLLRIGKDQCKSPRAMGGFTAEFVSEDENLRRLDDSRGIYYATDRTAVVSIGASLRGASQRGISQDTGGLDAYVNADLNTTVIHEYLHHLNRNELSEWLCRRWFVPQSLRERLEAYNHRHIDAVTNYYGEKIWYGQMPPVVRFTGATALLGTLVTA